MDKARLKQGSNIIFYDGVCGLCDRFVQFVLRHDGASKFLFCSLQSDIAGELLTAFGENNKDLDTVFVLTQYDLPDSQLLNKARAVFFVLEQLKLPWYSPWYWLTVFKFLPDFFLDIGYDFVAAIRYKIFGHYESCPVPSPEWRDKFID